WERWSGATVTSDVKLPRLGQGMEAGTIVKWLKSEGDRVEKGEPLFEVDTDKATQEVEAEASGVLLKIAVESGEVPVGQTIAVIGEAGEDVSVEAVPEETPQPAEQAPAAPDTSGARYEPHNGDKASTAPEAGERIKASPLARRI